MKVSDNTDREKRKKGDQFFDSQFSRRNFLKFFGAAAVSGGTLLGSTPASSSETARSKLKELAFQSNSEELYWRMVRAEFALKDELIHMNTGTLSTTSNYVLQKVKDHFQVLAEDPYPTAFAPPYNLAEAHVKASSFLGTDEDEIVVTGCTTEGMSFVAMGLDLGPEDEVLTTMHEHSGGLSCWQILRDRRGITLTEMPFQASYDSKQEIIDLFESKITSNTKVMSFCHINYTSGLRMPVKELCALAQANGIISVIDGAHAIGMLNLDLHDIGCDFYACSPQKWLCAPPGVGVLYAKKDKQDLIWPTITEAYGSNFQTEFELRGQRSSPVLVCLKDAMDFQDAIIGGKDAIEARIMSLSAYAKARLMQIPGVHLASATNPELSSGLTAFYLKDQWESQTAISTILREQYNILIRTVTYKNDSSESIRRKVCRMSTHIYNNYDQIDLFARAIEENLDLI